MTWIKGIPTEDGKFLCFYQLKGRKWTSVAVVTVRSYPDGGNIYYLDGSHHGSHEFKKFYYQTLPEMPEGEILRTAVDDD